MPVIKRIPLTKASIDSAKATPRPYRIWDAKVPGLTLRVLPSGRKTYEVHWGRNKARAIGRHGSLSLEAARETALRLLGEVAQCGSPIASSPQEKADGITFGDFISEHYGPYVLSTAKAGKATLASIQAQFDHLNKKPLSKISRGDFDAFKVRRLKGGIHPATVNRDLDRLKAALSKAAEWGLVTFNPLTGVRRIKREVEGRLRYLAVDEEKELRAALLRREEHRKCRRASGEEWRKLRGRALLGDLPSYTDHLLPMTLLAINTGLRRGELTQLVWRDIDMDARRLTVRAGYAKSGKSRHVPLNSEAYSILQRWRAQRFGTGTIFEVKSLSKAWGALMVEAKLSDFRFHDLRHTFASKLVMAGVDLNTVRELLGHGDIKMTLRYAHLAPEHKADAVQKLVVNSL